MVSCGILVGHGVNLGGRDGDGITPLCWAVRRDTPDMVRLFTKGEQVFTRRAHDSSEHIMKVSSCQSQGLMSPRAGGMNLNLWHVRLDLRKEVDLPVQRRRDLP